MPTELEFIKVKISIAKGIYGKKAVTEPQWERCHAAALNVFETLGTPAYAQDDVFMGRKFYFTYIDREKRCRYFHEVRTALDMFESGFCDAVWTGGGLGLVRHNDEYVLRDGELSIQKPPEEIVGMWLSLVAERYGK